MKFFSVNTVALRETLTIIIIILVMALAFFGCSVAAPTLADCGPMVDASIVCHGEAMVSYWGLRSTDTGYKSIGAKVLLSGAALGGVAAPGLGPALATGVMVSLMNIFQFTERSMATNEGSKMALTALGTYGEELTASGLVTVPSTCMTPYGAKLYSALNAAKIVVSDLLVGLLPKTPEVEKASSTARMANVGGACK
jgi:hypothetical protein